MNIILLSGGSGQRLWPMSGPTRSKQFLQLLDNGNGGRESMIQRVVRQIKESGLDATLTLATNSGQKSIIQDQLGEDTQMVLEPERRDTFPAIALACSYLSLEKQLPDDECVVVMPCDPYTEPGYFKTIARMAEAINSGSAEMALMGITPNYPSVKFGYIVPASTEGEVFPVQRFTEKPDATRAAELLKQGALWNGGVFAFKLGYLMKIVRQYSDAVKFEEVVARYGELPKISFDYEVVEKAQNVVAVPFTGQWMDLGTWNAITEILNTNTIGNIHLGPNCENVFGINETEKPIFIDGLKDSIVVASEEGVLVCSKDASEGIKDQISKLK